MNIAIISIMAAKNFPNGYAPHLITVGLQCFFFGLFIGKYLPKKISIFVWIVYFATIMTVSRLVYFKDFPRLEAIWPFIVFADIILKVLILRRLIKLPYLILAISISFTGLIYFLISEAPIKNTLNEYLIFNLLWILAMCMAVNNFDNKEYIKFVNKE